MIASEDAASCDHTGVEWDAIEKAWKAGNQRAEARRANQQPGRGANGNRCRGSARPKVAKVVGGSTITQQLAEEPLPRASAAGARDRSSVLTA